MRMILDKCLYSKLVHFPLFLKRLQHNNIHSQITHQMKCIMWPCEFFLSFYIIIWEEFPDFGNFPLAQFYS